MLQIIFWLHKFELISIEGIKSPIFFAILLISIFLHGKKLHHLILLQIWHIISQVIGYRCLYPRAQSACLNMRPYIRYEAFFWTLRGPHIQLGGFMAVRFAHNVPPSISNCKTGRFVSLSFVIRVDK